MILLGGSDELQAGEGPAAASPHGLPWEAVLPHDVQGLASGAAEPIIVGLNFMDRWASTTALAASRMAMVEPVRHSPSLICPTHRPTYRLTHRLTHRPTYRLTHPSLTALLTASLTALLTACTYRLT